LDRENISGTSKQKKQIFNKSEVRVVTFDLDNTIWKTGAVISSANEALANHLDSIGIEVPVRVEQIMGTLFKSDKGKYCPILSKDIEEGTVQMHIDEIKAPVLLTQLRKDAVMAILLNQTMELEQELEHLAEEAFQVWTQARHDAIPLNLATSVLDCLQEIRNLVTRKGHSVVVGAITDGNSDPRKVEILKSSFDFVINAETVGISKPDRRIYDAAIQHISADDDLNHVFDDDRTDNIDDLVDKLGPWWVHIGDDFMKDIVAAKDLKMRSVWSRELILDKLPKREANIDGESNGKDLVKAIGEGNFLKMIIGTEDYLSDELHGEFADAIVDDFSHVSKIISSWHEEGLSVKDVKTDLPDYFSIVVPDEKIATRGQIEEVVGEGAIREDSKFCIECGENLPRRAKFCASCGNKQPLL
jgi:FMN phosphatase YigB (HAD superfamily)